MLVLAAFLSNTAFNFVIGLLLARFLGPDQYGRFALAVACGVAMQTVCFDWARVAAVRFYSARVATDDPAVRATLDGAILALVAAVLVVAVLVIAAGVPLPLPRPLAALAAGLAVVNGIFDYWTALIRARFLDRVYARLILLKNLLACGLMLGGALWFGSAGAALAGLCLSMAGSAFSVRADLATPGTRRPAADRVLAVRLMRYALPVVLANLLYQTIPLADRLLIAHGQGFASSGQFSLAYDIGLRIVAAVGSALDVFLFQIAVRADELHGTPQAKQQVGTNSGVVFAVLLPACVGLWIVVPSFEAVVVPSEFRGPFGHDLGLLLPGLFCYGMLFFALHPLFQIGKNTAPLVVVALGAAGLNLLLLGSLPAGATAETYAAIQAGVLAAALAGLAIWALRVSPVWPRGRDLLGAIGATAAMALACAAIPVVEPGALALAAQVGTGVLVYGGAAFALDLCGLRALVRSPPSFRMQRSGDPEPAGLRQRAWLPGSGSGCAGSE